MIVAAERHTITGIVRPLENLRTSGLLWLINRVALHPRGFALALAVDATGVIGWQLVGDGTEPWAFSEADDDQMFKALQATLVEHGILTNEPHV